MTNSLNPRKLVVIGNGMAAGRVLDETLARDAGRFRIIVFGAEPRFDYNRILLSSVLAGEARRDEIVIHDEAWYRRNNVTLHQGESVVAIDRAAKTVTTATGRSECYDELLIATGSTPILLPIPGADLTGVVTFRDLDDVDAMLRRAERGGRVVVIGGGLLGLEAAAGLRTRGLEVTVLHLMPTLMERQLDAAAGDLLRKALEARGIEVITEAQTQAILGTATVEGVQLSDGRVIASDMVVMAIGIRPNARLAKAAGLAVARGVEVDDAMTTSDPHIRAVGECVEHRGQCYGLVAPLYEMAKIVAARLCGDESAVYRGSIMSTRLKVTGVDLFSAGDFSRGAEDEEIVLRDPARGVYKRIVLRDDHVKGAVLYGDAADGPWLFELSTTQANVSAIRDALIFGRAYANEIPMATVAASRRAVDRSPLSIDAVFP